MAKDVEVGVEVVVGVEVEVEVGVVVGVGAVVVVEVVVAVGIVVEVEVEVVVEVEVEVEVGVEVVVGAVVCEGIIMPAFGEDWMIEASHYAEDHYGLTLEQLGFDFDDGSQFFDCPQYVVDQLYDNYDPSPEDRTEVTRIGGPW